MKNDYPISQLRLVKVIFYHVDKHGTSIPGDGNVHYMHESQVETFISATVALHHEPGINPHNGAKTASLWEIKVCGLDDDKSYWWCDPTLKSNNSAQGAKINQAKWAILGPIDRVWACPTLWKEEHMARERELKSEIEALRQEYTEKY
jgi:hypothetical protein